MHCRSARASNELEAGRRVRPVRVASSDGGAHRGAEGDGVPGAPAVGVRTRAPQRGGRRAASKLKGDTMALDRHGMGLTTTRMLLGVFFLFMGLSKTKWFLDTSILGEQLSGWLHAAAPGSMSRMYLERIAIPGVPLFARL